MKTRMKPKACYSSGQSPNESSTRVPVEFLVTLAPEAATALSKEEVTVEDASDEDVMRPDPPSTSSSRDKQVDEADLPTNQDLSDDWEDVPEEEVPVISSVKEAAGKKLSPKKNQATIKSMFQRQKKQQQDQQRGQSNGDAVAAGDYKFNLEDPITAVMDEALVQ
eukprot:scaffold165394_cov30-Cyclotella_meneghiniana.AAC.1